LLLNRHDYWLVNSNRSVLKRFIKNDKKIDQFFEYMFIDSREVFGYLGKEQIVMQTTNCNANNKLQWKQQIQLIWSKPE
tara:strand:+ start:500 stop:736 length:237 start_codon:yes stop_codon:yes gene_type:complete